MSNTRVRKPPGGDSSFNIFGIENEPNDAKKATANNNNNNQKTADNSPQKATSNSAEKATDSNTEKATISDGSVKTDDATAKEVETCQKSEDKNENDKEKKDTEAEDEEKKKDDLKDDVDQKAAVAAPASVDTTKDSPANGENQNTPESAKNKSKAAYNPITGEPYGSPEKTETVNANKSVGHTRVRQPPGGTSSKLW